MPSAPFRRSPLSHRHRIEAPADALRIAERPHLGKFVLRIDPSPGRDLLVGAVGISLPTQALTSGTAGDVSLLWLGPDEWLLVTPDEAADGIAAEVQRALAGVHHQFTAVSDYYTTIEIAGPRGREALMKLTTLDLHPKAFPPGMVAGSMFAKAHGILWLVEAGADGDGLFRLFVRWSMADYLWCTLADAGREWGIPPQTPVKGERLTIA